MPSIRCEAIDVSSSHFFSFGKDRAGNAVAQTTTATPNPSSAIVFGPVSAQCDVMVRAVGGQAYIDCGKAPAAGPSKGLLIDPFDSMEYCVVRLEVGESIAAVTASVT